MLDDNIPDDVEVNDCSDTDENFLKDLKSHNNETLALLKDSDWIYQKN